MVQANKLANSRNRSISCNMTTLAKQKKDVVIFHSKINTVCLLISQYVNIYQTTKSHSHNQIM